MHQEFSGTLTNQQVKQHVPHTFTVPAGASEVRLHFTYQPGRTARGFNALHLSLFDPHGFRGAGHRPGDVDEIGVSHTVVLSETEATPGYLRGPLPAGEWSVVIDTHMILPGEPVSYQITVDVSTAPQSVAREETATARPAPHERGPGWYRGDLHGHTVHSDASWQIADLVAAAQRFELDFVTLSDHNTVSGLAEFEQCVPPTLVAIAGQELTTYWGHALALGVRQWIDWRVRRGERSMPQIAAEVEAAGGLFIIAHPMSEGDPICTGCDWHYLDMMPGPARLVEIWNGGEWGSESYNERALALWYGWLNEGHHIIATAGTDVHGPPPAGVRPGFNVVYAPAFAESALLHAIAQGHLFLSDGPHVELIAETEHGQRAMMGDTLPAAPVVVRAQWQGCGATDYVRLIANGEPLFTLPAGEQGDHEWHVSPDQAHWCALEIREASGRLRVVTNPIWISLSATSEIA